MMSSPKKEERRRNRAIEAAPPTSSAVERAKSSDMAAMAKGVGCVGVVWAYGCGCRWVWVKALVRLRRGMRSRALTNGGSRRHSLLDFMMIQRHAFINNLPSVYCAAMVSAPPPPAGAALALSASGWPSLGLSVSVCLFI